MMHRRHGSDRGQGRLGSTRRRSPRLVLTAVVAALTVGVAACGSSCGSGATYRQGHRPVRHQLRLQDGVQPGQPDAHTRIAAIQDGQKIKPAFQQALNSSLAKSSAGAKLDSYKILSASACTKASVSSPCAKVVYDIDGPTGTAILPNSQGYAVYVNGKWLVAKATICGLLGLFYQAAGKSGSPAGC